MPRAPRRGWALPLTAGGAAWSMLNVGLQRQPGLAELVYGFGTTAFVCAGVASLRYQAFLPARIHGSRKTKMLALTFDDGPTPGLTPVVLEALAKHNVSATFFMLGKNIQAHPSLARYVLAAGHEVGTHGFSHRWSVFLRGSTALADLAAGITEHQTALGQSPRWFRPPYGISTPAMGWALRQHPQLSAVGWSLRTRDGTGQGDPTERAAVIAKRVQGGDILLLHDGLSFADVPTPLGPKLLPILLARLVDAGYTFGTVSTLVGQE